MFLNEKPIGEHATIGLLAPNSRPTANTNNIKRVRIKPFGSTRTLLVPLIGLASLEPPDKQ